jgi:hypothetical protein
MENIISEERWNEMSEGEKTNLFLVNALRMLNDDQRRILTRGLLDRLEEKTYRQVMLDSAIGRGFKTLDDVTPEPEIEFRGVKFDSNLKKVLTQIIEEGFEEYLNSETVDKMTFSLQKDGVEIDFDIYDDNRDCVFSNTLFVKISGLVKASLHEAYEGCGIEEHIQTNMAKLIGC